MRPQGRPVRRLRAPAPAHSRDGELDNLAGVAADFSCRDNSISNTVNRLATDLVNTVDWHCSNDQGRLTWDSGKPESRQPSR